MSELLAPRIGQDEREPSPAPKQFDWDDSPFAVELGPHRIFMFKPVE
jgi:hypothetical protein